MATRLFDEFGAEIKTLTLVPSGGGVFEVEVNKQLVHSKKAVGQFPEEEKLVADLKKKFPQAA